MTLTLTKLGTFEETNRVGFLGKHGSWVRCVTGIVTGLGTFAVTHRLIFTSEKDKVQLGTFCNSGSYAVGYVC